MRRNIALLHYSAQPVVGGVESVMGHHARLLASAGHDVCIIAGRGSSVNGQVPLHHLPLADSLHPEVLAAKRALDQGLVPDGFHGLVERVGAQLVAATQGRDLLIAHNVCSLHKNLALTAALRQMCAAAGSPRLICWHHDLAGTVPRYSGEMHPGWPWDLVRQDWPEVRSRHVVVSDLRRDELSRLMSLPEAAITVVPSGLDMASFLGLAPETRALLGTLSLESAAPVFLLPVRLTRRKNIELALATLAALRHSLPEAKLIVTGPIGPHNPSNHDYLRELKALRTKLALDSAVHFLADEVDGFIPDAVINDLYRVSDALLFPSKEEGFGIPIIEAGMAGIPVFCADIPPLREIAGDNATFFLPDDRPEVVAGLITQRLSGDDSYLLRRKVRQEYAWSTIYRAHIAPLLE